MNFDDKAVFNVNNNNNHVERSVVYSNGIDSEILFSELKDMNNKIEKLIQENAMLKEQLKTKEDEIKKLKYSKKNHK